MALDGVDLSVAPGEIHALIGPNGAGKTTLTRALCGLVAPMTGRVHTEGPIGFVPSGDRTFYMRISALENLVFFARLNGLRLKAARRRALEVLDAVGLGDVAGRPVGRLSHGMQKRLSVARALLAAPRVLLIDEATHDLDPEGVRRIQSLVSGLADDGAAVLWTTQRLDEIRTFAHRVTFLRSGSVAFCGTPGELAARAPIDRYLLGIRVPRTGSSPSAATAQLALGSAATIVDAGSGSFVLTPAEGGSLGQAIGHLVEAGLEVVTCRQAESEMEQAFLLLAGQAA